MHQQPSLSIQQRQVSHPPCRHVVGRARFLLAAAASQARGARVELDPYLRS